MIGTLGMLKMAKTRHIISSVKEFIDNLLSAGYHIEDRLIQKILQDVGESQ